MATNKKTGKKYYHPILDENVAYATYPKEFLKAQRELTSSAIRIYNYFMMYMNFEHNASDVEASYKQIQEGTGINDRKTLSKALLELAIEGWIGNIKYQFDGSNIYTVNVKPKMNKELVQAMTEKREHMRKSRASIESGKNPTNGKFEITESVKNPTTDSSKNPTYGGRKNPTLYNNNTKNESKNGKTSSDLNDSKERSIQPNGFLSGKEISSAFADLFED